MHHPHEHHPDMLKGIACVMFAVLVWAGWVISSRYSVKGVLSTYDIAALRFGVAGIIMLPVLLRKGWRVGPWGVWGGIFLAATMGAGYNVIAVQGMKYAPTAHASLIQTTMLVSVSLLSVVLKHEPVRWLRLLGVSISVAGILVLLAADDVTGGEDVFLGHTLFLIAGFVWSLYALAVRTWKVDPLHVAAAVCVYSGLIYVPIYLLFLPSHIAVADMREVLFQAGYQGFINSVLALLCFNRSIAILGASTSSAFLPLVPVLATLGAIPLLSEVPSLTEWTGILLASSGVFLSTGIAAKLYGKYLHPFVQKALGKRQG